MGPADWSEASRSTPQTRASGAIGISGQITPGKNSVAGLDNRALNGLNRDPCSVEKHGGMAAGSDRGA